jgi:hypothetical protein
LLAQVEIGELKLVTNRNGLPIRALLKVQSPESKA